MDRSVTESPEHTTLIMNTIDRLYVQHGLDYPRGDYDVLPGKRQVVQLTEGIFCSVCPRIVSKAERGAIFTGCRHVHCDECRRSGSETCKVCPFILDCGICAEGYNLCPSTNLSLFPPNPVRCVDNLDPQLRVLRLLPYLTIGTLLQVIAEAVGVKEQEVFDKTLDYFTLITAYVHVVDAAIEAKVNKGYQQWANDVDAAGGSPRDFVDPAKVQAYLARIKANPANILPIPSFANDRETPYGFPPTSIREVAQMLLPKGRKEHTNFFVVIDGSSEYDLRCDHVYIEADTEKCLAMMLGDFIGMDHGLEREYYAELKQVAPRVDAYAEMLSELDCGAELVAAIRDPPPGWLESRADKNRIVGLLAHKAPRFHYYGRCGSAALFAQASEMFGITVEQAQEVCEWTNSKSAKRVKA